MRFLDLSPKIKNVRMVVVSIFFSAFLATGLMIYGDYGVHWDEANNQAFGKRWTIYISDVLTKGAAREVKADNEWLEYFDRLHGPAFEVFLNFAVRKLCRPSSAGDRILMRHLLIFLLFYLAVLVFYRLCELCFNNWRIALLGSLMLVLHPRIFAHSFYDSMDIAFLSFYVISCYTLVRYLNDKTYPNAAAHAVACAILVDIRIFGLIFPIVTIAFAAIDTAAARAQKEAINKSSRTLLLYLVLLPALIVLWWPFLWENPLGKLFAALNATVYFKSVPTAPISPWYYTLQWIGVTTPVLYCCCFLAGLYVFAKRLVSAPKSLYLGDRMLVIAVLLFFVPIAAAVLSKATIYDGWRHFYFIYPMFVIIAMRGISELDFLISHKLKGAAYKSARGALYLILILSFTDTALFMIKNHPHQQVYASVLAGKDMRLAKVASALDYWGLSYRQALEYIIKNDRREKISILVDNTPGALNARMLPDEEKKRLFYVKKMVEADYYLSNHKWCDEYKWQEGEFADRWEYYSISVNGIKFMTVYKMRK